MAKLRSVIVAQAKAWLGRKESDGTHKVIIDIYNRNTSGYNMTYKDPWCACFASAVAIMVGYTDIIPTSVNCNDMISKFKNKGSWVEDDSYKPSAGDYIFYDWDDNGVGDNRGSSDHVGIVEKVSGNTITVIEGNKGTPGAVARREIQVNGRYIRGYGVPKYDKAITTQATTKKPVTANISTSSAKVESAKSKASGHANGTKYHTTDALNMRVGAGTSKKIIKTLSKGTLVTWYGYYTTVSKTKWYLIKDKTGATGFVCSKYLK